MLNNATEVITANWTEEMLMYAQREDVGAVGAKLYYTDIWLPVPSRTSVSAV